MSAVFSSEIPPLAPEIMRSADGAPYLAGSECQSCGHRFVGHRTVCANCCVRDRMNFCRLAEAGTLYTYTIVHRAFPGVKTPYVDVIVDLEDGAHIKGTLLEVDPNPTALAFDMPVRVRYREAFPRNREQQPYLTYYFGPA